MAAPDDENGWGSPLLLPALGAQGLYYFPFPASPPHVTADERRRAADAAMAGTEQALGELTQHLVGWRRPVSFHSGGYPLGRTTASLFGEDAVAPAVSAAGAGPAAPVDDEPLSDPSPIVVEPSWLRTDVPTPDRLAAESAKFSTLLDGLKKGSGRPVFATAATPGTQRAGVQDNPDLPAEGEAQEARHRRPFGGPQDITQPGSGDGPIVNRREIDDAVDRGQSAHLQLAFAESPTRVAPPGTQYPPTEQPPATEPPAAPSAEDPPSLPWSRLGTAGGIALGGWLLDRSHRDQEASQVRGAIEKFHLDPNSEQNVLAARAYVWGRNIAPMRYWAVPTTGSDNERVAEALMRNELAHPGQLGAAVQGDAAAGEAIDQVVKAALKPADDPATQTANQHDSDNPDTNNPDIVADPITHGGFDQQSLADYKTYQANGGGLSLQDWYGSGEPAGDTNLSAPSAPILPPGPYNDPQTRQPYNDYLANGGNLTFSDWLAAGQPSVWAGTLGIQTAPSGVGRTFFPSGASPDNVAQAADETRVKPYSDPTRRPEYAHGQVEQVWRNAQDKDGNVYDKNTGVQLFWDRSMSRAGQWDMGHLPNQEYRVLWQKYINNEIDLDTFLREYRDPNNYQPESSSSNRSRLYEGSGG